MGNCDSNLKGPSKEMWVIKTLAALLLKYGGGGGGGGIWIVRRAHFLKPEKQTGEKIKEDLSYYTSSDVSALHGTATEPDQSQQK